MQRQLRSTRTTRDVLSALIDGFDDDLWGFRLCHLTGLPSGTVYPILSSLEDLGWVETRWDDSATTGPRRRFYRLTPSGLQQATRLIQENTKPAALPQLRPTPGRAFA